MQATIREARSEDAERLVSYVARLAEEPGIQISLSPGEFTITAEQERQIIADYAPAPNSLFLVAEAEGRLVGMLSCKGGARRSTAHVTTIGISVDQDWRDQGIGSRLMQYAIDWARQGGVVKRMELYVFAENYSAIHLYEKLGFAVEGRLQNAIFRNGKYNDDLVMALLLEE